MKAEKCCAVILKDTYHIGIQAGIAYQMRLSMSLSQMYRRGFHHFHIDMACNPHEAVRYLQFRQEHAAEIQMTLYADNIMRANLPYIENRPENSRRITPDKKERLLCILNCCDEIITCKRRLPYLLYWMLRHRKFRSIHIINSYFHGMT